MGVSEECSNEYYLRGRDRNRRSMSMRRIRESLEDVEQGRRLWYYV